MKKLKAVAALMCCVLLLTACENQNTVELTSLSSTDSRSVIGSQQLINSSNRTSPDSASSSASISSAAQTSVQSTTTETLSDPEAAPQCTACELYCVEDKTLITGENIDMRVAPASLTKLLTASVALRYVSPNEVFTVGTEQEFVQPDSSLCFIAPGQMLTMYDLITGMLLPSGNDAAYTVAVSTARKVSGSAEMTDKQAVEYFCGLMNDFAKELGMDGSHFADPDGWDNDEHYTTVSDLVKLAKYALTVPEIREIVAIREKQVVFESGENATWINGNMLIHPESEYYCKDAIGMKTGATDNAGYCLIAAFEKGGKTYVSVVVGSEEFEDRYEKILELYRQIPS